MEGVTVLFWDLCQIFLIWTRGHRIIREAFFKGQYLLKSLLFNVLFSFSQNLIQHLLLFRYIYIIMSMVQSSQFLNFPLMFSLIIYLRNLRLDTESYCFLLKIQVFLWFWFLDCLLCCKCVSYFCFVTRCSMVVENIAWRFNFMGACWLLLLLCYDGGLDLFARDVKVKCLIDVYIDLVMLGSMTRTIFCIIVGLVIFNCVSRNRRLLKPINLLL